MSEAKTEKKVAAKKETKAAGIVTAPGSKHPAQHVIKLALSNKETIDIVTTWGSEGETLRADIDPFNHPAWQDGAKTFVNANNENMNKFMKKFSGFGNV